MELRRIGHLWGWSVNRLQARGALGKMGSTNVPSMFSSEVIISLILILSPYVILQLKQ
jgi:hypothetical protein